MNTPRVQNSYSKYLLQILLGGGDSTYLSHFFLCKYALALTFHTKTMLLYTFYTFDIQSIWKD